MKLNLLPTTEKKSRAGRTAVAVGVLIVAVSIGVSIAMLLISKAKLETAKSGIPELEKQVADADVTAKSADTIIASAADVIRNAQLAQAMIDHNDVYFKLYDDVKRYVPPYYRLQSISATPISATDSQVTLIGTLSGYQRYADLMLALYRFKDATSIARSGYALTDPTVPALVPSDQVGKMRRANQAPIPDDGLERLAYFEAQASASPSGYLASGYYGSGSTDVRGPLPDASLVRIDMVVHRDLQVPLPADTLRSGGGGAGAAGATGAAIIPGAPPLGGSAGPAGPPPVGGGREG